MFGFGFALVPLYDVLCEQLGINGKTQKTASRYSENVIDYNRRVTIEFVSQVQTDLPWSFTPKINKLQVHPGELIRTHFVATSHSNKLTVGQAIPSVSPGRGAAYFNKTECFCFNQQRLTAKSSAEFPLIFYVDPDLPDSISTLTLSYTLYNITDKIDVSDLEQGAENDS